jgi:hypothetical protein
MASPNPTSILHRQPGRRDSRHHLDPHAAVLLILPNRPDLEGVEFEGDAVVGNRGRQHLGEHLAEMGLACLSEPEQVEISRGPVRLAGPEREERGALQHETRAVA